MARALKFTIRKFKHGKKMLFRIRIPARFSMNGKQTDVYYDNRTDAENDQSMLRSKYANNELTLGRMLAPGQVRDAQRAFELIKESGKDLSLIQAVKIALELGKEYAQDAQQAVDIIGASNIELSLVDAVHMALEQRRAQLVGITVTELMEKYEEDASTGRAWSDNHKKNWKFYSTKFSSSFGERNIADIQAQELREWFAENYASATYFNSATSVISPAFSWAVKQEILKRSPFEFIEKRKVVQADGVDVFTPEESKRLLSCCRSFLSAGPEHPMSDEKGNVEAIYKLDCSDAVLPFSMLLFAGIRPEELQKMTWELVHLDKGIISIPPSVAKTNQVRNIELHDNLKTYLESIPEGKRTGKIIPANWVRKAKIVRKAASLQNRADAPRHSFASYSLAVDPSVDRLRENMGHSKNSDVLFKHYRAAVRKADALEYWSIDPKSPYGKK